MVQLSAQLAAQVQVTVDHVADDAQHHVGGAVGHATCTDRAHITRIVVYGAGQQAAGVGFAHRTVGRVHAQQDAVKHRKADWAGVNALQDRRARAFAVAGVDGGRVGALRQAAKHHQVVLRAEVVA